MRTVVGIVRARRNQFDGVGAEDHEIANVLLPHRYGPRVVGVGLRAVSELVAAYGDLRRGDHAQAVVEVEPLPSHVQLAKKVSGSKQHTAIVIPADDRQWRGAAGGYQREAFGGSRRQQPERGRRQDPPQILQTAQNDGRALGGNGGDDRQSKLRALLDLAGEHESRFFARRSGATRENDGGVAKAGGPARSRGQNRH